MTKPIPVKILELFKSLSELESAEECQSFLEDLCTPTELSAMADRWEVAKLLSQDIPYRKIYEQTGTSTATVTRVARALSEGAGYQVLIKRQMAQASAGKKNHSQNYPETSSKPDIINNKKREKK
jgi:TrpR-related protein YerC/YecD